MELVLLAALVAMFAYVIWMGVEDTRVHKTPPARLEVKVAGMGKSAYPAAAPSRPPLGLILDGHTVVPSAY